MPSLSQIRTKISSVKGTSRIMSAMKLISAVKLQKVQGQLISSRPYSDAIKSVAENVSALCDRESHPLLRNSEEKKKLQIIFMTSDRGLCGSFNSSLIRKLETYLATDVSGYESVVFRFVGRRGFDHFTRAGVEILDSYIGLNERNFREFSARIGEAIVGDYVEGEVDDVVLVYNYFKSALTQVITFERILPITPAEEEIADEAGGGDYLYEPNRRGVLESILPKYVEARVDRAVLETITSEHAARMAAMDSATRNADDVVRKLTLEFNKSRQAMITTELMDIVNGTEALNKGDFD